MTKKVTHELVEYVTDLTEYNNQYSKSVIRVIWNDNPITTDIRIINKERDFIGKGISLNEEECEKLVNILIKQGYGSIEEMKKAIVREMGRTNPDVKNIEDCGEEFQDNVCYTDEDGYTVITIPEYI